MTETTTRDPDLLWRLVCQKDEVNDALRAEICRLRKECDHANQMLENLCNALMLKGSAESHG